MKGRNEGPPMISITDSLTTDRLLVNISEHVNTYGVRPVLLRVSLVVDNRSR